MQIDGSERVNPSNSFDEGKSLFKLSRYEEAIQSFDKAIADSPDERHPEASNNKGIALARLGRYEEAIQSYDKAITDSPEEKYPEASRNKGLVIGYVRRYEEAIKSLDKAIADSTEERFPEASFNKGLALAHLGRYEEAIQSFDKAIADSLDEKYPEASYNKGLALAHLGRHEEAIQSFDKAITHSPDERCPEASYSKGATFAFLERYEETIQSFDEAINHSPDARYPKASYSKGLTLAFLGRYEEAILSYSKAIRDAEDFFPIAWFNKAVCLLTLNRIHEARDAAFNSVKQDNNLKKAINFITEHINKHPAYESRQNYLDIAFIKFNDRTKQDWKDINTFFSNQRYINNTDLYCELLLEKKDLLNTHKNYYERLRLSYMTFATNNRWEWVYYIIDHLLDDGNYQLDNVDYFFYLTAANSVAASRKELEYIIEQFDFSSIPLNQIDEYLFQLANPLPTEQLINYIRDVEELNLILNHYLKNKAYETEFTKSELVLNLLVMNFERNYPSLDNSYISDVAFLNLRDSLSKPDIYVNQVAINIENFIDGKSPEKLAIVLYHLTDEKVEAQLDSQELSNASALLKAFCILKHHLLKNQLDKKQLTSIQFVVRNLIATTVSDITGGVISMTYLFSLSLSYAIDFCLNQIQAKIKLNPDFTWDEFIEKVKDKSKRIQL